jgi:hypothetical protein
VWSTAFQACWCAGLQSIPELALLYSDIFRRSGHKLDGPAPNPFFGQTGRRFRHLDFPIYLITRLAGFDFRDVRGLVNRSLATANRGKFVNRSQGRQRNRSERLAEAGG